MNLNKFFCFPALYDYEAAIKLDPKNSSLNADRNTIRKIIQGVDPTESPHESLNDIASIFAENNNAKMSFK